MKKVHKNNALDMNGLLFSRDADKKFTENMQKVRKVNMFEKENRLKPQLFKKLSDRDAAA